MPGVAGLFSSKSSLLESAALIAPMTEALKHFPQQQSYRYHYRNLLLGRVDLGVFTSNIQPKETRRVIAFIWGELLNSDQEREEILDEQTQEGQRINDLDFLVRLYERCGDGFPRFLKGSFNAFIVDKGSGSILIANDRLGLRPLYYCCAGDRIVFASEVNAILKCSAIKRQTDLWAVADFFHFGFISADKTLFEGIHVLPQGSLLKFLDGDLCLRKYWNLKFEVGSSKGGTQEYIDQLSAALQSAVELSTSGNFRFGLPLSGGLDSRVIAACIPKQKYPISIWTWGAADSQEVRIAKAVSEKLKVEHHSRNRTAEDFVVNFQAAVKMTDGMLPANLPMANFLFSDSFMGKADICLDGTQSICVMYPLGRGYGGNEPGVTARLMPSMPEYVLRQVLKSGSYRLFEDLAAQSKAQIMAASRDFEPANRLHWFEMTQEQPKLDFLSHIVKRNFVEIRTPLLDYAVIDVVQRIPVPLRKQRYIYYKAFRQLSPALSMIRIDGTGVPVSYPHWIQLAGRVYKGLRLRFYTRLRANFGFPDSLDKLYDWGADYDAWYRDKKVVKTFTDNVLSPKSIAKCEYLNAEGIRHIVEETFRGGRNHARILNRLMTHVLWRESLEQ